MRQLATPAGIDHDYNFLSAIERSVERSDRLIVEERKLVGKRELLQGPQEERGPSRGGRGRGRGGGNMGDVGSSRGGGEMDQKIRKEVQRVGVRVEKLPKGMARQKANGTSWSKKQKCVVWQVEWVREKESTQEPAQAEGAGSLTGEWPIGEGHTNTESSGKREGRVPSLDTAHSKILTTTPLGDAYAALLEEHRRAAMTPEEKSKEKKRRAQEIAENETKKPKLSASAEAKESAEGRLSQDQDQEESQEKADDEAGTKARDDADVTALEASKPSDYNFYLYRPHTPSNLPIVLIPLRPDLSLDNQLQGKVIVEYPTIYVFPASQSELPEGFMLQDDFFKKKGIGKSVKPPGVEDGEIDSGSESDEEDEGSGSEGADGLEKEDEQAGGHGLVDRGGEPESDTSSSGTSDEAEDERMEGQSEDGDVDESEREGSDRSQEYEGLDHTP